MNQDRELLEWAAKAAGFSEIEWQDMSGWGEVRYGMSEGIWNGNDYWNPLVDDGDAFRLATACGLSIEPYPYYAETKHSVIVKQRRRGDQMRETNPTEVVEVYGDDPYAATRRAITRAAASIGQSQENQK